MLTLDEYRAITEQSPILIWRARTDKLCDYFNERWLAFRGRTLEQEFGHGWTQGVHADDYEKCFQTYVTSFDKREAFEMYYRLQRHDGAYRWLFDRGSPYNDASGQFAGYIGSCIDVTERIDAEQALAAKRAEELAQLRKLIPVCSWCKRIRTDDGYWREIEAYFASRNEPMTHGICSDCEKRETEKYLCESVRIRSK
jgi:PAS domain S-box-containing protein